MTLGGSPQLGKDIPMAQKNDTKPLRHYSAEVVTTP
jgi:hypothetical protein